MEEMTKPSHEVDARETIPLEFAIL